MSTFKVSLCAVVFYFVNSISGNVIVDTKSGKLEGKQVSSILPNEKYYSFLGIPYAQPPLKELRFMPPVPHPGWNDTLQAKKEKPQCAQYNLPMRNIKQYGYYGSEDCLYLSIHTPKLPANDLNLPVIVFLYNENFRISYNASKDYGPDFLMKENVILVTISHRLGSLGFLSFGDKLLPGNNGIRDVILALKWIKDNVKSFGGDPSKVTLMGSSGGATIVDILLHSPKAKGLFNAAILQSESSWKSLYYDDNPKKRAIELSKILEQTATTSASLLQRLSDISAFQITESELLSVNADDSRLNQRGLIQFGPIVEIEHDDAVITSLPENSTEDLNVPVMIGFNSREGIEMCNRYLQSPNYLTFADRDFLMLFPIRVGYRFELHDNLYRQAVQEIKDYYFDQGYVKISKPGEYITYIGDISTIYSMDYTVRAYTNTSSKPIYYYMFDYSGELNFRKKAILEEALSIDGTWGASLNDDLCYVFVCHPWRKVYKKLLENDNADELKVLRNMVKFITNFAKTGNPTPPGSDFDWKPATKEKKQCLVINDEPEMKLNIYEDRINFWDNFLDKYKKLAVDGVVKDIKDEL